MTAKGCFRILQNAIAIYCPGCECYHMIDARWKFNNNWEKPTIIPSLLINYPDGKICHSYITEGYWRFLSDCSHHLKGQEIKIQSEDFWS